MRKFYKLSRFSMKAIMVPNVNHALLTYSWIPINLRNPEFNLGIFSSKRKAYDRLMEIEPRLVENGKLVPPASDEYSTGFGTSELWFSDSLSGSIKVIYMIEEVSAE